MKRKAPRPSDFLPGMTLDQLIEAYPGLGYAVAATEAQTKQARKNYAALYGEHSAMKTRVVRAELVALLDERKKP